MGGGSLGIYVTVSGGDLRPRAGASRRDSRAANMAEHAGVDGRRSLWRNEEKIKSAFIRASRSL